MPGERKHFSSLITKTATVLREIAPKRNVLCKLTSQGPS